ncbi:Adhesin YadA precursor [compost metagenome]
MKRLVFPAIALPITLVSSLYSTAAHSQSAPLVNVCSGLSVDLPVLQPVTTGILDPLLNPLASLIDLNIAGALSGQNIGLSVLDTNGQAVSSADCGLAADSIDIDDARGISMGGGSLSGLGGAGNAASVAGEVNSVAIGNGATTSAAAANAIALGLRGTVTAANGVALGADANVSAAGGVALGSGSVASRAGMGGATELFSGTAVSSTAGAVSVGTAGGERQITNVAGGTADTDAVNVRQLRAVSDTVTTGLGDVAIALGGGSTYNSSTNVFTGPSYTLRGNTYTDVNSALQAINSFIGGAGTNGALAANNTSGLPNAVATGADATAVGYGSSAAHANSTAIGRGATTTRAGQVMIGTSTNTYTMPGVTSVASRAAQSGPTQVLTTDAAGNIASANIDVNRISSDISNLRGDVSSLRRETRKGIAAAMSMTAAPKPSAPGKTSWSTNIAGYHGEMATSFAVAHMFDSNYPVIFDASVGYSPGGGSPGVRVGLSGEF